MRPRSGAPEGLATRPVVRSTCRLRSGSVSATSVLPSPAEGLTGVSVEDQTHLAGACLGMLCTTGAAGVRMPQVASKA